MSELNDFQKYHDLRRTMTRLIKQGRHDWQQFSDAWEEMEEIKNRHGGLPPIPTDDEAFSQELCEIAVENGLR